MKIRDGAGSGFEAKVNIKQRLDVAAASFPEAHLVSALDGQCYVWTSSWSSATGLETIYIKNDSKTKKLIISHITVGCVTTGTFELYTATGVAAGTPITGVNMNRSSNNVAAVTAYGAASVTGITPGERLGFVRCPATDTKELPTLDSLVLGFNDAITITWTGSTSITDANIIGYFETEDAI